MLAGSKVFGDIQQKVAAARRDLDAISKDLQGTGARLERLAGAESRSIARLAEVRLEELEARRVVEGLDAADRHVIELLDRRRRHLEKLEQTLADSDRKQEALDAERVNRLAALDDARATHGEAVVAALAELEKDEAYGFQHERSMELASQAEHAAQQAALRMAEREEKGRPYESSKLFLYLWRRHYGTPEYDAGNLARALDGWVAKLCDYDRSRRDYEMLLEIPERLQAHADRLADEAQAELDELGKLQADAFLDAGIPKLADAVETLERELREDEAKLEAEERQQAELLVERAAFDTGDDKYTHEARKVLRQNLEREPVHTLRADALRTPAPADDAIVAEIASNRDDAKALRGEARLLGKRQETAMRALADLEELRRRYRQKSYDSRHSTFRDGFDTGGLLEKLLRGGLVIGDVMQEMNRNHRFRVPRAPRGPGGGFSFPDFGSRGRSGGGIRFPSPGPSRSPSRPSRPSRPSGGGGGFRTGGGF